MSLDDLHPHTELAQRSSMNALDTAMEFVTHKNTSHSWQEWNEIFDAARAELAQLRATVSGQEQQLRQATDLIRHIWEMADSETSTVEIETTSMMWQIEADTRAWLAANAPQPTQFEDKQDDKESGEDRSDRFTHLLQTGWN